jgi:hypothetical protein
MHAAKHAKTAIGHVSVRTSEAPYPFSSTPRALRTKWVSGSAFPSVRAHRQMSQSEHGASQQKHGYIAECRTLGLPILLSESAGDYRSSVLINRDVEQ